MTPPRSYDMTARARAVERTRERILAAAREAFFSTPFDDVTVAGVAAAAGTSHQTLLNHFGSKEGLFASLVEQVGREIEQNRGPERPHDARSAVRVLVRQYEASGDVNARLAAVEDRIPAVAEALEIGRRSHQEWLARSFADHLPASRPQHRRTLAALHAATDVYTWKLLRRDLGLSRAETTAVMERLVHGLLTTSEEA
ncbi:MAG TPA: TetR/AcrR family transcriptional regulator [Nocardioides sp.]|nr:TetR/AcrR family transcriptional regulator [Nocardioides sp.]